MFQKLWKSLNSFEFGAPDPHTFSSGISCTPFQMFLYSAAYLLIVYKIGPDYMKSRKPFDLKNFLLLYNFAQMLLNFIIVICAFMLIVVYRVTDVTCMMTLPVDHPKKNWEIFAYTLYYLLKIIDYADTIFFVLRKSTRQITFLHVYHHILMANSAFLYFRYYGYGGHIAGMGILNSLVHVIMYFYYFTSAWNPSMKSVWWKKYITILQLVQFALIFLHNLYPLLYRYDCQYPHALHYLALTQSVTMLYLFGKFYINAYMRNPSKSA